MARLVQLTVHLREDQVEELDRLRDVTDVPTSRRIRDAVDELLKGKRGTLALAADSDAGEPSTGAA